MPTGRFSRKTHRQLAASTSAAPSVGPRAPAAAPVAPQMATAWGTFSAGKARSTRAREAGMSRAEPAACPTRKTISSSGVGARAQASDATVKTVEPSRNRRLWPSRSPSFPAGTRSEAKVIV